MIPTTPTELMPYKVPAQSLKGNEMGAVALDRTQVFRFPNNRGLSVTYNARGDAQVGVLQWDTYRLTDVKLVESPFIVTHKHAPQQLLALLPSMLVGQLSESEKRSHRLDLVALIQVGLEERNESYRRAMSNKHDDFEVAMSPSDPSPTLDWAAASLNTLPMQEQEVILTMLERSGERMVCTNIVENQLRIEVRRALEAGRIEDACEFLGRIRDSHGILAYDDMLLEAANIDLVSNTKFTRRILEAIAKREDAITMMELFSYFRRSKEQTTDIRYLTSVIAEADANGLTVKGTGEYDAATRTYKPRKPDNGISGVNHYLKQGFSRGLFSTFEGKAIPELSSEPVDVTQLVMHLQKCYGRQGVDPFVGMEINATSSSPYDQVQYQKQRNLMRDKLLAMMDYCTHQILLQESQEQLTPQEQLLEHFNSLGTLKGIVPGVTLAQLNVFLAEKMDKSTATLQEKIEWYIERACDIFLAGEMQYQPINEVMGGMTGWPRSLLEDVKIQISQAWDSDRYQATPRLG